MGNSNSNARKGRQAAAWNWDFSSGRPQMKPRTKPVARRPLFKPQPSDDYNWWIFNPDPPKKKGGSSRSSSSSRRRS